MATAPQEKRIFREAVQAALLLDQCDLILSFDEPFAIRFDDDDETWFGAVNGLPGEGLGLVIVRGPAGLRWIRDRADTADDEGDLDRYTERVEFVLGPMEAVPPARRGALAASGVTFARDALVPAFDAKERNKSAHDLRVREAKRITKTMCALMKAIETDADALIAEHPPGVLPTLRIAGDWRAPDVGFELASYVDDLGRSEAPVRRSGTTARWPVVEARWSVAVVNHAFGPKAGDESWEPVPEGESGPAEGESESPLLPVLLVVDTDAKTLVGYLPLIHRSARAVARMLVRGVVVSAKGRLLRRFASHLSCVDPTLRDALAEALEPDGVACVVAERDEAIEQVHAQLDATLEAAAAELERGDFDGDEEFEEDDLEDDDEFDDEFEDDDSDDDHVHGPGCDHGHGPGDDFDDASEPEQTRPEPDAVDRILRDVGLAGGPGTPPR